MDPFHANYPFLDASRDAVREADVGLAEIITSGGAGGTDGAAGGAGAAGQDSDARHPAVERGVQRVERALLDGTIDLPEGERHPGVQAELLSYPVARVLVSLLDTPGAIDKYADAEAATAYERFTDDFEALPDDQQRPENGKVPLRYFLHEFDLAGKVEREDAGQAEHEESSVAIDVAAYLRLSSDLDGHEWRLIERPLADGRVTITEAELHRLLRVAVRQRVASGLPTTVPEEIRAGLTDEIAELEESFSEIEVSRDIAVLDPECFPPCASALVERAQAGESLSDPAEFALVSFLTSANADPDELLALTGADSDTAAKAIRYRAERVGDESGAQYAPPSCETMAAYGECPIADEESRVEDSRCETISHPLAYYEEALADAD